MDGACARRYMQTGNNSIMLDDDYYGGGDSVLSYFFCPFLSLSNDTPMSDT